MKKITPADFDGHSYRTSTYLSIDPFKPGVTGREGWFQSKRGYVRVYVHYFNTPSTSLTMLYGGRTYHRRWLKVWGDRTVARLAREFADEVVAGRAE